MHLRSWQRPKERAKMSIHDLQPFFSKFAISYAIVVGSALSLAACTTVDTAIPSKESSLAAAGFIAKLASTPQRKAMLMRLPPNKFLLRTHGNTVNYVYADPSNCNCLYVGSQQAYDRYRQFQQQEKNADRQMSAAQAYQDANWDWRRWGPWISDFEGPFGPGYGW